MSEIIENTALQYNLFDLDLEIIDPSEVAAVVEEKSAEMVNAVAQTIQPLVIPAQAAPAVSPKAAKAKKPKPAKPVLPDILKNARTTNAMEFFADLGITEIGVISTDGCSYRSYYHAAVYTFIKPDVIMFMKESTGSRKNASLFLEVTDYGRDSTPGKGKLYGSLLYVHEGTLYCSKVSMNVNTKLGYYSRGYYSRGYYGPYIWEKFATVECFEAKLWKPIAKYYPDASYIQSEAELKNILAKSNPYAAKYVEDSGMDIGLYYMLPQIEILDKAGYAFASNYRKDSIPAIRDYEKLNRLIQSGRNPKEIFKCPKAVYSTLKNCTDMDTWDAYRRLVHTGKISADSVQVLYTQNIPVKLLNEMNSVLNLDYEGKKLFTLDTLTTYLNRLDNFEGIENKEEAFGLIIDYVRCCKVIGHTPTFSTDSLKREHDIVARLSRHYKQAHRNEKIVDTAKLLEKFNYSEAVYSVRAIRDFEDLLDEANQQSNCVAGYAEAIGDKTSYIFVMRETRFPDKSLVTIELSPGNLDCRQKYMSHNRPIHNKSMTEFIERWVKHCKAIARKKA